MLKKSQKKGLQDLGEVEDGEVGGAGEGGGDRGLGGGGEALLDADVDLGGGRPPEGKSHDEPGVDVEEEGREELAHPTPSFVQLGDSGEGKGSVDLQVALSAFHS